MSETSPPTGGSDPQREETEPTAERFSEHLRHSTPVLPRSVVITDDPPSVVNTTNTAIWTTVGLVFTAINGILIAQLFNAAGRSGPSGWQISVLVASFLAGLAIAGRLPRFIGESSYQVDRSTFSYQPMWGKRVTIPTDQIEELASSYTPPPGPEFRASLSFQGPSGRQRVLIDHSTQLVFDAVRWFRSDLPVRPFVPHLTDSAKVYHAWREMLMLGLLVLWPLFVLMIIPDL